MLRMTRIIYQNLVALVVDAFIRIKNIHKRQCSKQSIHTQPFSEYATVRTRIIFIL